MLFLKTALFEKNAEKPLNILSIAQSMEGGGGLRTDLYLAQDTFTAEIFIFWLNSREYKLNLAVNISLEGSRGFKWKFKKLTGIPVSW